MRHGEQSSCFAWPSRKTKTARIEPFYSKVLDSHVANAPRYDAASKLYVVRRTTLLALNSEGTAAATFG
jgi:hypothetical protein